MTVYRFNKIFKVFCTSASLIGMYILNGFSASLNLSIIYLFLMFVDLVYCFRLRRVKKVRFVPSTKTVLYQELPYLVCIILTELLLKSL